MKQCILLLLTLFTACQAYSEEDPAPLGRLFFSPQQRAALDRERLLGINQRSSGLDGDASYTFTGEVRRSSGKNTRWINGEPITGRMRPPEVPVGDTYHPATGERETPLGDGRIVVNKTAPAK